MKRIYLDHNATTLLDPQVASAMLTGFETANPSSTHWFGRHAFSLLTEARDSVASFFRKDPSDILFTSGGTESLNLLLRGLGTKGHIITTSIEHSAIYNTVQILEKSGLEVTYLEPGLWGAPLATHIADAVRPTTRAIVLSLANGETGVKIDLEAIATLAETWKIPLFLDAVAYIGKEPLLLHPGIGAIAISAHKFHGPKGIGALYLRPDIKLTAQITGGSQELTRRGGTENLPGILGLAEALRLLKDQPTITSTLRAMQGRLEAGLTQLIPDTIIHGQGPRIVNTTNIAFLGVDGEALLMQLDLQGIAVSHGSACNAHALEPSRILLNMGIDRKTARSSIRLSLGRTNTFEEIDRAVEIIADTVKRLREMVKV